MTLPLATNYPLEKTMTAKQEQDTENNYTQMVLFRLAKEQFAVEIQQVKEIVRPPETTKIPMSPEYIAGIANLRGNVLPILDTRQRLDLEISGITEHSRILVVEVAGYLMGLHVDSVLTVKSIARQSMKPPPPVLQNVDSDYVCGVIQEKDESLVTLILDVAAVTSIEINQGKKQNSRTGEKNALRNQDNGEAIIDEIQLVTFSLSSEIYAFEIETVREIMRVSAISEVPNAPEHIKGLITVRENVMPVLDLRTLLGVTMSDNGENERILIVEINGCAMGLIVDRVREVCRYAKNIIQEPPGRGQNRELKGIVKADEGKQLIMILNEDMLLSGDQNESVSSWLDDEGVKQSDKQNANQAGEVDTIVSEEVQMVTFNIGDEEYGIRITEIQEINRLDEITYLPKSPVFIEGVTNLRGNVIPVINVRKLFGMEQIEKDDRTRIIIVDVGGRKTGLCVDKVAEVLRLFSRDIESTPAIVSGNTHNRFMQGVCKLEDGRRIVILLDVEQLLNPDEMASFNNVEMNESVEQGQKTSKAKAKPKGKGKIKSRKKSLKKKMEIDE